VSRIKTVGISTDGLRDYVTMPDGVKVIVSQVGMARLVAECSRDSRDARRALNEFLKYGESMIPLDLDRLAELTQPPKVRNAFADSLVNREGQVTTPLGRAEMDKFSQDTPQADKATKDAISNQIARIEEQIQLISSHASEASAGSIGQNMQKDEVARLKDLVAWLRRGSPYGDQSKNKTYYGLPGGTPGNAKSAAQQEPAQQEQEQEQDKQGSFSALTENSLIADVTLAKVDAANTKIDLLVTAGKRFDYVRAKEDLFKVASGVHDILHDADLAQPWVKDELTKFANQAQELHGLFAPAKV
jgi:hypothetical protein